MTVGVRTSVKVDPPDVTVKTSAVKRAARTGTCSTHPRESPKPKLRAF
jgi:hypothetical protein